MGEWGTLFWENSTHFYQGTIIAVKLTLGGLAIGFVLGLTAALLRVYTGKWLRWLAVGYIEFFRGTPILVQLFVIYYGLPSFGVVLPRMAVAYLTMGLNSGAFQAEFFRGAIQAIGSGQMKAARSIGMNRWKAVRHIILPQALRLVIPAWSNEPIGLLKASATAFLIAIPDLMGEARIIASRTFQPIPIYLIVTVIYLTLVFILTAFLRFVEKRVRIPGLDMEGARR